MVKAFFPLPSREEQDKIVEILNNLTKLIQNKEKIIQQTKQLKRGLMQKLLIRGIGHSKFKEVQGIPRHIKFEIPEEWDFTALQDVCNTTSGGTPLTDHPEYYDGEIPWLTTSELQDNFVSETKSKITEAGFKSSSANKIPPNSTIVAMYGATIGKTCINTKEITTNQACCVLIPKKEKLVDTYFLQQILIYFRSLIVSLV